MTSIPNFSIDVYLLDISTKPPVPTAATGADISLSQAAGRVLPDDGSSGRARRGSSKRWRIFDFEDWSNSEFEGFAARGCLRFDVSLCGCWMGVEMLYDQGQAFGWKEHVVSKRARECVEVWGGRMGGQIYTICAMIMEARDLFLDVVRGCTRSTGLAD